MQDDEATTALVAAAIELLKQVKERAIFEPLSDSAAALRTAWQVLKELAELGSEYADLIEAAIEEEDEDQASPMWG